MPMLLVPHILGFAPLTTGLQRTGGAAYLTATAMAAILLAQTTAQVVSEGELWHVVRVRSVGITPLGDSIAS